MEIQATFRHLQPTEELEKQIFDNARALDALTGGEISFCHVVVEGEPDASRLSQIRVRLSVLGTRSALGVSHDLHVRTSHEHPLAAIADAFDVLHGQITTERMRREARDRSAADGRPRAPAVRRAVLSWA